MVPLFFHPEVSLDFVVVRQSSVNLLLPIILIFLMIMRQHLIFKMGVTLDAVLVKFLRLTMRNL